MGKFIILVHASLESEAGKMPTPEEFAEMSAFNNELTNAGALITADGLLNSTKGARLSFSKDAPPVVQDGPFDATNLVAGFWILKLDSFEDALAWAKKIPFKEGSVEVRKIASAEDFGDALPEDIKEKFRARRDEQPVGGG